MTPCTRKRPDKERRENNRSKGIERPLSHMIQEDFSNGCNKWRKYNP